jgi:hypothetical protein
MGELETLLAASRLASAMACFACWCFSMGSLGHKKRERFAGWCVLSAVDELSMSSAAVVTAGAGAAALLRRLTGGDAAAFLAV